MRGLTYRAELLFVSVLAVLVLFAMACGSDDEPIQVVSDVTTDTSTEATVVATGCYAQRRPDDLREAGAGLVVGNDQKADLVDTVHRHLSDAATVAAFDPSKRPGATRFLVPAWMPWRYRWPHCWTG